MRSKLALLVAASTLATACGGDSTARSDGTATSDIPRTYAGMTEQQAREAIRQTIPEANSWIRTHGGNAEVTREAAVELLSGLRPPESGGREAWAAQLPLQGDTLGDPNAKLCIWVWRDP